MVTIRDIEDAARRIDGLVVRTPLLSSPRLDEAAGGRLLFKAECLQTTGSFKLRGASNAVAQLEAACPGVVAYSSGNHAQAVALAAARAGLPAAIVMPADAPRAKRERTAGFGAEVILYNRASESREAIGEALAAQRGYSLIPPFDFAPTVAGQGTAGLEAASQCKAMGLRPDRLLVCCSGGGLAAGMGTALRARFPACEVVTVEPDGHDDAARSFATGTRIANDSPPPSVCDALMAPRLGDLPWTMLRGLGARGAAVSDEAALRAVAIAARELRVVLEPGGAVALASALGGEAVRGGTTLVVLSGGNVDETVLIRALRGTNG